MKKIALVGTSPIMLIVANHLSKLGNNITIFNVNKKIGGAWAYFKFNNHFINTQTNVIVPDTKFEERNIPLINEYLKKEFKVKININKNKFQPLGYLAKINYNYKLNNLYQKILNDKKINFSNKFLKEIICLKNKVKVNNKIFDKIYVPTYCGINKIKIENETINIKPQLIISEHAMIISKKLNKKFLGYSENFDQNFDRAQIRKVDDYTVFTARVRKEKKGRNILKLIKNSKLIDTEKDIVKIVKTKYKNFYRNFEQRDYLMRHTKGTAINYVNTALFVEGFFLINENFKLIKKKYK